MTTNTSSMGLILATIGVDSGLIWEQSVNASFNILDGHNHAPGSGVQINPDGLDINADLPFNNSNATALRSARFQSQTAPLALPTDLDCLYVVAGDLYYNDGADNEIRITQSGSVTGSAGTITGLPSGTASAAYVAGTFVFQSATATPANIDGESFILRNDVANSKGLTLSPPSSMANNYTLTLPTLPAIMSTVTLDTSGNFGTIPAPVTPVLSASSGTYANGSTSFAVVTGVSSLIAATGRPVMVMIQPDGSGTAAFFGPQSSSGTPTLPIGYVQLLRDATVIAYYTFSGPGVASSQLGVGPSIVFVDTGASAGNHTYTVQVAAGNSNNTFVVNHCKLVTLGL